MPRDFSQMPQSDHAVAVSSVSAPQQKRRRRVLIADNDKGLVERVCQSLVRNGFGVITAHDGPEAMELAAGAKPDLVLLELMLPGAEKIELAKRLKSDSRTAGIALVMLTAKGEAVDVVAGLTLGAEDYITKPFSMDVLMARINTIFRRLERAGENRHGEAPMQYGPLAIDSARHEVTVDGAVVNLTLTEFKLLVALVEAQGRVLSRHQLMDKGMGADVYVTDRAIDVHVTAIRKKLGKAGRLVQTVRGVGYRLQEGGGGDS